MATAWICSTRSASDTTEESYPTWGEAKAALAEWADMLHSDAVLASNGHMVRELEQAKDDIEQDTREGEEFEVTAGTITFSIEVAA